MTGVRRRAKDEGGAGAFHDRSAEAWVLLR